MPVHGPRINTAFTYHLPLLERGTRNWKANPTIEVGDFWISQNGGAETSTLTVEPVVLNNYYVKFSFTAAEMNTPVLLLRCHDQSGDEWDDTGEQIFTTAAGSGSGVVVSASATLVLDTTGLANELAPIVASILASMISFPSSTQWQQIYQALGVSGTGLASTGTGLLDEIFAKVADLTFNTGNVTSELSSISASARTDLLAIIFESLTSGTNRIPELTGPPSSTPTVAEALAAQNMINRNARVSSATQRSVKNDEGVTVWTQSITGGSSSVTIGEAE